MYIIVMFDLPTQTKKKRKEYTNFRKKIMADGFFMLQYSVYARFCKTFPSTISHKNYVINNLPKGGEVRVLTVTEKVFLQMEIFSPEKNISNEEQLKGQQIIEF